LNDFLPLLGGIALLIIGSDYAVRGSLGLAYRLGWSEAVAGLLLLALGTSLPELFVGAQSAPLHPELAVGTIMGSNAFNVGIVLGVMLLIKSGTQSLIGGGFSKKTVLPLFAGTAISFWAFLREQPTASAGFLFALIYLALLLSILRGKKNNPMQAPDGHTSSRPLWRDATNAIVGFALLAIGADFFLSGALNLAAQWGWSAGFAGYLIAAIGTSSPELATSIQAMRRGNVGVVFGNVLGSNTFNLLLVGSAVGFLGGPLGGAADAMGPEMAIANLSPQLWVNAAATLALLIPAMLMRGRAQWPILCKVGGLLAITVYALSAWWVFSS
jgi:cation:H+ antiporter